MTNALSERMKGYEEASRNCLPNRLPVILRLDGKAFHTYTKGMKDRPFNRKMIHVMEETAIEVCKEIQGAQLAYVQSDEISILVHGYKKLESQPWFSNNVQKMTSVAASIAGATFTINSWKIWAPEGSGGNEIIGYMSPAYFDCRAFVVPENDVCNYFVYRQQDCIRNSAQGLARSIFSHKQCDNANVEQLKLMCKMEGSPWEELSPTIRYGRVVKRIIEDNENGKRSYWQVDTNVPIFQENRSYIEDFLTHEK